MKDSIYNVDISNVISNNISFTILMNNVNNEDISEDISQTILICHGRKIICIISQICDRYVSHMSQ
jgi:hypothetical protein